MTENQRRTLFSKDHQPTAKQRLKARKMYLLRKDFYDTIAKFLHTDRKTYQAIKREMMSNPEMYSELEWKVVFEYLENPKFITDLFDRTLGRPHQSVDITTQGSKVSAGDNSLKVTIVDTNGQLGLDSVKN